MKPLRCVLKAFVALCLVLAAGNLLSAAADEAGQPNPETLLAQVRALALTAELQLSDEQISSLEQLADDASSATVRVEEMNAESWGKVGDDIWNAIEQTLTGATVPQSTWASIQQEVDSNRHQVEPISETISQTIDRAASLLTNDQQAVLGISTAEAPARLGPALSIPADRWQPLVQGIMSVKTLSPQQFLASRRQMALLLARDAFAVPAQADYLAPRILDLLDAMYALPPQQFQIETGKLPDDIARYLGVQPEGTQHQVASDQLNEGDFDDFLLSAETPSVLEAILQGGAESAASETSGSQASEGQGNAEAQQPAAPSSGETASAATPEGETASRTSDSQQWENALAALDCLNLATTLSLSPEQMQVMASPLQRLFKGKLPEDRQRLLDSKAKELAKVAYDLWAASSGEITSDLLQRAEKLVASLRVQSPDPEAARAALAQVKGLLTPAQSALIDWGDSSLLPGGITSPTPAAAAQQQRILNYLHERLVQARFMPARSRKGRVPPQYRPTRWRFTLADDVVRDITVLRPVSANEYPRLIAVVQNAILTALSMSPDQFNANGYQLAADMMYQLGLGAPPTQPMPPPPPILESEFDRIMLDPAAAQVLQLGGAAAGSGSASATQ